MKPRYLLQARALKVTVAFVLANAFVASGVAATEAEILEHHKRAQITELWQPEPEVVSPGDTPGAPPSDAIVLFDGGGLEEWESVKGGAAPWGLDDGVITVVPGKGDIRTRRKFSNVQLHIEWATPREVTGESQGRGNSGVFFMEEYEVQILDSYQNPTYSNGQAASVYKQHIPLVNASLPPAVWQTYDIIFTAPTFGKLGRVIHPAYVTVLHNGVLVQNHVALQGPTEYVGEPQFSPHGAGAIKLQDHGNTLRFRNIWVREL